MLFCVIAWWCNHNNKGQGKARGGSQGGNGDVYLFFVRNAQRRLCKVIKSSLVPVCVVYEDAAMLHWVNETKDQFNLFI